MWARDVHLTPPTQMAHFTTFEYEYNNETLLFNMNRILYPTTNGDAPPSKPENNHQASAKAGDDDDDRNPPSDSRGGGGGNPGVKDHVSGWEGLTPLQFVEKITKQAESKVTSSQGQLLRTHCVDPALMMATATTTATSGYADGNTGRKRGRMTGSTTDSDVAVPPPVPLPPWDLTFLIKTDPDPRLACDTANKLGALALQIETSPNYFLCSPSYKRLREELAASCQLIHAEHINSPANRRSLLDNLYAHTVQKMEVLATMMKDIQPPSGPTMLPADAIGNASDVSSGRDGPPSSTIGTSSRRSKSPKKKGHKVFSKRDFASYMEKWLRDNWTNPYPDDDGLAEIADDCATTAQIVSNWLINARTRKWRPAIVKAYDLGRPADTLLEDAVNLFQGVPLRDLGEDVPYFHSAPLGKGKKGKSTAKGRK